MRIAIDARELAGRPTGVGRYLAEILREWGELAGARTHEFVLCAPSGVAIPDGLTASRAIAPGAGTAWEQFTLPRLVASADADVLFAPGYTGPLLTRVPMVVTVHDVSFAAHPEWFGWREGLRRRLVTRLAARRAVKVITVSDFSKDEIVTHLDIPESKVEVIYSGVTRMPTAESVHRDGATVLFVGSLFNRRHIAELVAGFEIVGRRHPRARLELVGDNRTRPHVDVERLIAQTSVADRIRARAYVPDGELAALYRDARVFVFLSEYEGFALTPLEALGAGIPIVLLNTDVAHEIYGSAAIYVERPEPALIAAALEHALFDEAERDRVLAAAAVQIERYSWGECAHRTLQILLACARNR